VVLGIPETERKAVAAEMSRLLADSYTLYLTSHNYHWNITGPMFRTLHLMFEEHYVELAEAVDEIAERIRSLGFPAPASYAAFAELSTVSTDPGSPDAMGMVEALAIGHETAAATARSTLATADTADDAASADLATRRIDVHEKTAWMLRSMLD
jgi:starvation-inducible DNA-binding protein